MHEAMLRDFFENKTSAGELVADISSSVEKKREVTAYSIEDMEENFLVAPEHLARVCDAFLRGELAAADVQAIGFCLIASDHFFWDGSDPIGERVTAVASDWSTPMVGRPITVESVRMWRDLLLGKQRSTRQRSG